MALCGGPKVDRNGCRVLSVIQIKPDFKICVPNISASTSVHQGEQNLGYSTYQHCIIKESSTSVSVPNNILITLDNPLNTLKSFHSFLEVLFERYDNGG